MPSVRIVHAIGARPNIVKMAPVVRALRRRLPDADQILVHTGQHYDWAMSDALMQDLGMPTPDHMLGVGPGSPSLQASKILERLEPILRRERPDLVVVAGDVTSTLAVALGSAQLGVPLAHVESGLRSFDRTMPEELNRVLTDHLADRLFAHCDDGVANLRHEGIDEQRISFVGNTMIDSLVEVEPTFRGLGMAARLGLRPGDYLLVTLHGPRSSTARCSRPQCASCAASRIGCRSCFRSTRGPARRSRASSSALTSGCWSRSATWSSARSRPTRVRS